MRLKFTGFGLFLIFFAAINLAAQNDYWRENERLDKLLLKKDLTQAIKEAENSSANDLQSSLRLLNLYHRVVNNPKVASTIKQIIETASFETNRHVIAESVRRAVKDDFFKDAETLRLYLQRIEFDGDIYYKFYKLCAENPNGCDVKGFDEWLARQAAETREKNAAVYFDWTSRRIDWREKFGFDNAEIFDQIGADVRENPSNLDAALRYLKFFRQPTEIAWLAETFASKRGYDFYELGETLSNSVNHSPRDEYQKQQVLRRAVAFLQKSLSLPYNDEDKILINSRRFRFVSVAPYIRDYEKQLRFWTKSKLAETYQRLNEPYNAQPIVEELAALDKSGIMIGNVNYLAGAVQAASGARVVESKILNEQALRQDSYEYWQERIGYYRGRKEPMRVFDAYRQSLTAVPFDLTDEKSRSERVFFIGRFADFAEEEFGYYANEKADELSDEQKQKLLSWNEAESFLRAEFERTKANTRYSAELARILINNKFKKLLDEIFSRNALLPVAFAKIDALGSRDNLLYYFLRSDSVSKTQKEAAMNQILKIAADADAENAWIICETVVGSDETGAYAARVAPILLRNTKKIENRLNSAGISDDERYELGNVRSKYRENLFKAYLQANDWKSAEKLVLTGYDSSFGYRFWQLAENAAKNGAYAAALRFWKLKANLNRRDLDNLETLARSVEIKENLKEFYRRMKKDEPFSPIPDVALEKLK